MPGAGEYAFGFGPAGDDPLPDPSLPRNVTIPDALLFDGRTADFPLDAFGRYNRIHPIDQKVALALIVRQGTVSSVPDLGNRLRSIKRASGPQAINKAKDFVNLALADLIKAGDIEVVNVQVEYPSRGQIAVAVTYRNLRTLPPRINAVRSNI